ncbi:MAG: dipeptide ABC transporter ATP-binding protein [Bdellovibrionales bacterium]|nr:dipeptide ABC transporter ATP-binding protein [Bdellovibrionales bacterium]
MSAGQPAAGSTILEIRGLKKHYPVRGWLGQKGLVKALDGVTFAVQAGRTLAVVGESGCGKSTLARVLLGVEPATEGDVRVDGRARSELTREERLRSVQMIFQDPYGSLNPRKRAWQLIAEPLAVSGKFSRAELRSRAVALMDKVGLRAEYADRYPHMFSGGQRQRLGIARALMLHPRVLICDEPVSALDVSIQAQVLNLLLDLQQELGLSYVFISHDLSVVRHLADEVAVLYLGRVAERGPCDRIFNDPRHPYTRVLLASTPKVAGALDSGQAGAAANDARFRAVKGELPSPLNPPPGCVFHRRCPIAGERCSREVPAERQVAGRVVACHEA